MACKRSSDFDSDILHTLSPSYRGAFFFRVMDYYVYILESEVTGSFYIGQTQDIDARLEKHNKGYVKSTKAKRPWKLV